MKKGEKVEITIKAGLCRADDDTRFVDSAEPGTRGLYIGRHKSLKGWHLVQVGLLVAPLGLEHFRAVDPE